MYWIFAPLRFIYKIYFGIIYITTGILLYPFIISLVRGKNKFEYALGLKKSWSFLICIFTLVRVKVLDKNVFPKNQPYIVCANHASYLDIALMFLVIPDDFAFLGKSEVLKYPIVNIFFKRGIDIPVYRGNVKRAKECIDLAAVALENGRSIAIFPQGGMDIDTYKMRRFKNGAFVLAIDKNVPIVPVAFLNNWKLFSDHTRLFGAARPGIAMIKIHPPIYPDKKNGKDSIYLRDKTYDTIHQSLEEYANR